MVKTVAPAVLLIALSGCIASTDRQVSAQEISAEISKHVIEPCYTLMAKQHRDDADGQFSGWPANAIKQVFKSDRGLTAHMEQTALAISEEVRNARSFRDRRQVYDRHADTCRAAISML